LSFSQITLQPANTAICANNSAAFTVHTSGTDTIYWELNNGSGWLYLQDTGSYTGSHTDTLRISHAGTGMNNFQYRSYVVGNTCPAYSSEATLTVYPLPVPSLKISASSPEICRGATMTITAGSGYTSYLWNDNSVAPALTIKQPGLYWVEVSDSNNCSGKDSITISPCEKFFIPNAFTPNNDGLNDIFKPIILGTLVNYKFTIYDRWGQLVFQSSEIGKGWNGMMNGSYQPAGVYVWTCRYQTVGNKENFRKGTVVLVR
jgi:gliding motility-associated-like protein